jgi:hypothetical protein
MVRELGTTIEKINGYHDLVCKLGVKRPLRRPRISERITLKWMLRK